MEGSSIASSAQIKSDTTLSRKDEEAEEKAGAFYYFCWFKVVRALCIRTPYTNYFSNKGL